MALLNRLGVKMSPRTDSFGSFARFNPGCVREGEVVHMLYRSAECSLSQSEDYITAIGYAKLDVYGNILYDSNKKVIFPTLKEECMGCEDPRIVEFEGFYYIFYTAYDGILARVAVARTLDFSDYEKLGVIHHEFYDKDAFIFPKRINNKIAYMHRAKNNIQIDYFDSFDDLIFSPVWDNYSEHIERQTVLRAEEGKEKKIGGGAPPIYTDKGWILIYHSVDNNSVYRAEAALLDKENPSKVISKLGYPILEPCEEYELYGDVNNVTFPIGSYTYNDNIYIYYGAADKYIALAEINTNQILDDLLNDK